MFGVIGNFIRGEAEYWASGGARGNGGYANSQTQETSSSDDSESSGGFWGGWGRGSDDSESYSEPVQQQPRQTQRRSKGQRNTVSTDNIPEIAFQKQQSSRGFETYRDVQLRNMGGNTARIKKAVDKVLDDPRTGRDFRRHVKAIDYADDLVHPDMSKPQGYAGRGKGNASGVISTRTANTATGVYRNLVHELGHLKHGDEEEAAEAYTLGVGAFGEVVDED